MFGLKKKSSVSDTSIQKLYADDSKSGRVNNKVYYFGEDKKSVVDIVAPNGANTRPLGYMTLQDGGRDIYYCALTIDKMPKFPVIAVHFSALFNFKGVISNVFIHPLKDDSVKRVNKRIDMLDGETSTAEKQGDRNKARQLAGKMQNAEELAKTIDSGLLTLYEVQFLFLLSANSLEELQLLVSDFLGIAKGKTIELSACYGAHPEAFLSALPRNEVYGVRINPKLPGRTMLKKHILDEKSLSTIYNHTSCDFFHKDGIPLGHNAVSGMPVTFDPYDHTHTSYGVIVAGMPGYGKSATVKQIMSRLVDFDYHFAVIDFEAPNGRTGEYAGVAEAVGGVSFTIAADGKDKINFFEINDELEYDKYTGQEYRTLRVNDKIVDMVNILLSIALFKSLDKDSNLTLSAETLTRMEVILARVVRKLYANFGIIDGKPDSLYETVTDAVGGFSAGRKKKKLPTLHDFYMELLRMHNDNDDTFKENAYRLLQDIFEDRVKELYYCPQCLKEFTRAEYEALPTNIQGEHYHTHEEKQIVVRAIKGVKAYFDAQSTVKFDKNIPFVNFDISGAPEAEKPELMLVCQNFINEHFIKLNSADPRQARKLIVSIDEAHKQFPSAGARQFLNVLYRTARKRHVSPWLIMQSIADLSKYPDTEEIIKSTETMMLFKHTPTDRDKIKDAAILTDSQVEGILNLGGDEKSKAKKLGEMCLIDIPTKQAVFLQVDYLKASEQYIVETDAEVIAKLVGGKSA